MINEILVNIDYLYDYIIILDELENEKKYKNITLIFYKVFKTKQYEDTTKFIDILKERYNYINFEFTIIIEIDNLNLNCEFKLFHNIIYCFYISRNNKYVKEYIYYYNSIKNIIANNYYNIFLLLNYNPVLDEAKEHLCVFLKETSINISICYNRKLKYDKLYSDFVIDTQNILMDKGYNGIFKPIMNCLSNSKEIKDEIISIYCRNIDKNIFMDYIMDPLKSEVNSEICTIKTNFNNSLMLKKKDYIMMNEFMRFWNEKRINNIKNRLRRTPYVKNDIKKVDMTFIYLNRLNSLTTLYFPSFSLHTLSSFLNSNGYSSKVFECTEENIIQAIKQEVEIGNNIFGFYCACDNEAVVANTISLIKQMYSDIIIFVGGPQAYILNEAFFKKTNCDIVIEGEGEFTLLELIDYFLNGKGFLDNIKGIKYIDGLLFKKNDVREPIENLDELPFMKINRSDYAYLRKQDRLFIYTGRGCPYRCAFCFEGANNRKSRFRSMDIVFNELEEQIYENPSAKILHVLDDTFTANRERVLEFCCRMEEVRKHVNIDWVCEAHINTIYKNPDLIKKMVSAGLVGVQYGIESGDAEVLEAYNKNTTPEMICEVINNCVKSGLKTIEGNIIIGGAFESKKSIERSMLLCKQLIKIAKGIIQIQVVPFWPLPNTDMTINPSKYGLEIIEEEMDYSIMTMQNVVTQTKKLTHQEIVEHMRVFNEKLDEMYLMESLKMRKQELLSLWDENDKRFMGGKWGEILNSKYFHFSKFINGLSFNIPEMKKESADVYVIRSFENPIYIEKVLEKNNILLDDTRKKILKLASGKFSIIDISKRINCDLAETIKLCKDLEDQCLLYYSLI